MLTTYRLPLAFDAESLKAELEQIRADEWTPHFNRRYYEGEWKGLALRSTSGRTNQLYRAPDDTREATDTVILETCAYFRQVLNAFKCPILAARLLSLSAGSKILEHEDYLIGFEYGWIRLHIPVATDTRVEFFLGHQRLEMAEGETWYIDFNLPHRVHNASDQTRVHLVVDCVVNGWLRAMVPGGNDPDTVSDSSIQLNARAD